MMTTLKKIKNKIYHNAVFYKNEIQQKGLFYFFRARIQKIIDYFLFRYYCTFLSHRTFSFHKKNFYYFYHQYNVTWKNERCIEIPLIYQFVKKNNDKKILEIGNVLSHYFPINHDVIDKYEKGDGIYNFDIATHKTEKRYDLIVSISTLEHVGWDEKPREKMKFLKALKNSYSWLNTNGVIIFTIPLKYNKDIDYLLKTNKLKKIKKFFFKRVSHDNEWVEASWTEVKNVRYNKKYPNAQAIMLGVLHRT